MAEFTEFARKTIEVQIGSTSPNPTPNPTPRFTKLAEATLNVKIGPTPGTPSGYPGSLVISPSESNYTWLALAGAGIGLAIVMAGGRKHV